MERQNLILGLQAVSAIGILVIVLLNYFGQSTRDPRGVMEAESAIIRTEMKVELASIREEMKDGLVSIREEIKDEFTSVRTDMRVGFASIRTELRDMNTRLDRVERYLGMTDEMFRPLP